MFSWHAIPFARIIVPFIFGIYFALNFPVGVWELASITGLSFALLLYLHFSTQVFLGFNTRILQGCLITGLIIMMGYFRTYWFNETRQPAYFENVKSARYYRLIIDDAVVEKSKFYRCYARINTVLDSMDKPHHANGTILFYIKKGHSIKKPMIGDRFLVKANKSGIPDISNPEGFDYKKYLKQKNIYSQLFADSSQLISLPMPEQSLYRAATLLRDQSLGILQKYITSPKELGVAQALLLGYKDDLDPDIVAAFSRTGTLHVLAVSGLHAGIIYLILAFLTSPLAKKKYGRAVQVVIMLLGIWLYAFVTGLSSSVLRASVMFSFMAVGKLLKYHLNIYNNIFSSAFILLIYDPLFIKDIGFQLSYLAVLGIVFIQPLIAGWYRPRFWLDKYVWGLISVSLAAQLLTFPIGLYYFHQFPNYFLLSNLLIIPLTSLILIGLIALLVLHGIPLVGSMLGKAILVALQLNDSVVNNIDNLPYSYSNGLHLDLFQMLLVYAIMLLLISFMMHRIKYLFWLSMASIFILCSYFSMVRFQQHSQKIMVVHQIKGHDVITCIDGRKAVIIADSGFINNGSGIGFFLEPYFWAHGINKITKYDFSKSFVETNILHIKNIGIQFYDRILTIDHALPESVHKNGIILLKDPKKELLKNLVDLSIPLKISATTSLLKKRNIKKQYFKLNNKILKESESFILFRF